MSVEMTRVPTYRAECDRCGIVRWFVGQHWPMVHTIPKMGIEHGAPTDTQPFASRFRAQWSEKEATLCESCVAELIQWWVTPPDDPFPGMDRGWWGGLVDATA